jgi:hypothetical protein
MTPDFILSRAIRANEHPVDYFWELLDQLADDAYPPGVLRVPGKGLGTWAFSSGAGLVWWPGTPRPAFPVGGVMLVGDNLNAYGKSEENRGHWGDPGDHRMTYWRKAFRLLNRAGIPTTDAFFTNAYVGLIKGGDPSADFPGRKCPSFCRWCAAFLIEQIRVMQPCLVATLGRESQRAVDRWNVARRAGVAGKIVNLSHPSARMGYAALDGDAATLRNAYELAGCGKSVRGKGTARLDTV